jgi:hypothetical protein
VDRNKRRTWTASVAVSAIALGVAVGWGVWLGGPGPRLTLRGDGAVLWPTRFSPDGRRLVVEKRTPKFDLLEHQVWRLDPPRVELRLPAVRVYARAFSEDGRWFAQAYDADDRAQSARVETWDLHTGQEHVELRWTNLPDALPWNMSGSVLSFDTENRLLLAAANFGIWDVKTKTKLGPLESLSPLGPMPHNWESSLFGYRQDRRVRLYSLANRGVVSEFTLPADLRAYRWSEDGQVLAADFYNLVGVHVFDAATGSRLRVAGATEMGVQSISSDGQWLAGSAESTWSSWWRRLLRKEGVEQPVIRVFHVPTGELRYEFPGVAALFAPGATNLAIRARSGDVEIWDLPPSPPWLPCLGWGLATAVALVLLSAFGRSFGGKAKSVGCM